MISTPISIGRDTGNGTTAPPRDLGEKMTLAELLRVNRKWNNRRGEFQPASERETATRVRRTRAVIEAERAAETRTLPPTSHRTTYGVYRAGGGNHGGVCQGCGADLAYWIGYKLCDRCLKGVPISARRGYDQ